ncbi:hypothetical protein L195_g026305 [Trifolium pratense]|uniref:Uncharacterized protein n=1 Tax=Trifolium pratense TaxID=57577 RepID=A0A2K3NIY9_TRIPR|nr:hypothetical protein L195_g026305 [Trifolium pratense]
MKRRASVQLFWEREESTCNRFRHSSKNKCEVRGRRSGLAIESISHPELQCNGYYWEPMNPLSAITKVAIP